MSEELFADDTTTGATFRLFLELLAERRLQDVQWGGAEHDDQHAPVDWLDMIYRQFDLAHADISNEPEAGRALHAQLLRARLVKIAALALAGMQSIDRKEVGS